MAATTTRFTEVVRSKLAQNAIDGVSPSSVRALARVMGRGNEARSNTYRRSLFKWLADGEPQPSRESRALVAEALGLEHDALDEDDEESDPVAVVAAAIRHLVQDEIRKAA